MMEFTWGAIVLDLPRWLDASVAPSGFRAEDVEDRMAFVIDLARRNVEAQTGGPFAAAVFVEESGELVAPGVNRVVPSNTSFAHAEIMAIGLANQKLESFDLGGPGLKSMQLVASTEPCALCLGATVWSGVRSVVTGATDADARAIGFDEGPKVSSWVAALESRDISVQSEILRRESADVLNAYAASGQIIYNGRRDA